MTPSTSKLVNLGTLIQQLLVSVGQTCHGLETLSVTRNSQNPLTIDIILTGLCVKSSDTDQTTEANPTPSPANPNSQSPSSKISSLSIFKHSLLISPGRDGWTINYEDLVTWLHSQDVSDGSSADVMILPFYGRQLLMTLKVPSPT